MIAIKVRREPPSAGYDLVAPAILPKEEALSDAHGEALYVGLAPERNPDALAARPAVAAVAGAIPQETSPADPVLETTVWPAPTRGPGMTPGRIPAGIEFGREARWHSRFRGRGEVSTQEGKMALAQLAREELSVAVNVRHFWGEQCATRSRAVREFLGTVSGSPLLKNRVESLACLGEEGGPAPGDFRLLCFAEDPKATGDHGYL